MINRNIFNKILTLIAISKWKDKMTIVNQQYYQHIEPTIINDDYLFYYGICKDCKKEMFSLINFRFSYRYAQHLLISNFLKCHKCNGFHIFLPKQY